jgi:hypothetical protein
MNSDDWLNPFSDADAPQLKIGPAPAPIPPASARSPVQIAECRARIEAKIAQALAPMRRHQATVAAAPDPEAPLMALLAAHEVAVVGAAAAAQQSLAYRQTAWRQGKALDGHPVG